jgi:hypothetical protein
MAWKAEPESGFRSSRLLLHLWVLDIFSPGDRRMVEIASTTDSFYKTFIIQTFISFEV